MTLSEAILDIGKPFPYYPSLAKLIGVKECILLCRIIWWTGRQRDEAGWIYKTRDELLEETGLSHEEQTTARRRLVAQGLMEERIERLSHKMFYRVCQGKLDALWENREVVRRKSKSPETVNHGLGKPDVTASSKPGDTVSSITERTQRGLSEETVFTEQSEQTPKGTALGSVVAGPSGDGTAEPSTLEAIPLAGSQGEPAPLQSSVVSPKASRAKKTKPPTQSTQRLLEAERRFCEAFKKHTGRNYLLFYERDRPILKRLLDNDLDLKPEDFGAGASMIFQHGDTWEKGHITNIVMLCKYWDKAAMLLKKHQSEKPPETNFGDTEIDELGNRRY